MLNKWRWFFWLWDFAQAQLLTLAFAVKSALAAVLTASVVVSATELRASFQSCGARWQWLLGCAPGAWSWQLHLPNLGVLQ